MRCALEELDQDIPIANRRSPRQCNARARDETPVRTRDADGQGGTPTSAMRLNAAALSAAEALVRENRLTHHHSRNSENHLT